ncbi:DUF1801 domain-containing protein [Cellulophaga sp. F20128]|uniref:DUF1801 domain-containing protein n=1 Tax=Cellulophaga sp. F20128 TaxID=2926413 RepID=UPI001FF4EFC4|nr:DUF1801 domain-containing protein [Cellulophaga sp. F20128]MCK0155642.1 DUF1801 domain-containing protein [Cellulophaga sp. F20128]
MNPKVDEYLSKVKIWPKELTLLRSIILDCGLTEELKWGQPCYTYNNSNVVLLATFKNYCALSFIKGALLKDPKEFLEKPGEHTQSARLLKFTTSGEIIRLKPIIIAYIQEAIAIEKSGLKVAFKDNTTLQLVEELQSKLKQNPTLKIAFNSLTPGRQRAYNLYFLAAKQSKTRVARIEKYESRILDGKGIHDCTCGHSKKMPNCDGSHKYL